MLAAVLEEREQQVVDGITHLWIIVLLKALIYKGE